MYDTLYVLLGRQRGQRQRLFDIVGDVHDTAVERLQVSLYKINAADNKTFSISPLCRIRIEPRALEEIGKMG